MAAKGTKDTNGLEPNSVKTHRFDPNFTQLVVDEMGPKTDPRHREVLSCLIRHMHNFAREIELSYDEWMSGVNFVNAVGQIHSKTRDDARRVCDILGLESLVDEIAHKIVSEGGMDPTSTSILGPFWSPDAPFRDLGSSIIQDGVPANGRVVKMHGVIQDMAGNPIPNAVFDIWQASTNGKYDIQDPDQTLNNLRGKFRADDNGRYSLYCLYPTAYGLPRNGPSWQLLQLMDRHPMRPSHLHIMVTHPDFQPCTTQLYPKGDRWLESDTTFSVKPDLIVDFKPLEGDDQAALELEYNVTLPPKGLREKQIAEGKA